MMLTDCYCPNPFCSFRVKRGHGKLVGRINGQAELFCAACKQTGYHDSTRSTQADRVALAGSRPQTR